MSTFSQDSKPSNKVKKNKKKKQYKNKQDSTNLAIGVNTVEVGDKMKKKKDVSEITYYNYNKKRYYAIKCPKPRKSKN